LAFWSEFAGAFAAQVHSLCASVTAVYLPFFVFGRVLTRLDYHFRESLPSFGHSRHHLDIDNYFHNRILRWAGHVARMPMSRAPQQLAATGDRLSITFSTN